MFLYIWVLILVFSGFFLSRSSTPEPGLHVSIVNEGRKENLGSELSIAASSGVETRGSDNNNNPCASDVTYASQ